METVVVSAIRGNSWTRERSVNVTFELEDDALKITKGGVTGFESFYVDNRSKDLLKKMGLGELPIAQGHPSDVVKHGWLACAGTADRWDRLFVPASSMRTVAEHFGLWRNR